MPTIDVIYEPGTGKSYNVDRATGTRTEIVPQATFATKIEKRVNRLRADLRAFLAKVDAGTDTAADRNQAIVKLTRLHLAESRLARGDTDSDEADPTDT